eukprot:1158566-Pelagomonas_calceolata.AAC.12
MHATRQRHVPRHTCFSAGWARPPAQHSHPHPYAPSLLLTWPLTVSISMSTIGSQFFQSKDEAYKSCKECCLRGVVLHSDAAGERQRTSGLEMGPCPLGVPPSNDDKAFSGIFLALLRLKLQGR